MRSLTLILFLFASLMVWSNEAKASSRYALVIGNDTYLEVPKLDLARADAVAISGKLKDQGFNVTQLLDGDRRDTNRQISNFTNKLQPGDIAFLFYAGHGVEIDGENYLLPIDIPAPATQERDFIKSESIALSTLLDRIRSTGARTTIAVIDACRDNPFATATGRSIGGTRGLGRINAPEGMFVIFSAGAGQLALDRLSDDDTGANSVFTRKLLPLLGESDLELRQLMSRLRTEVRDLALTVNHEQVPAYYDELLGQFYFASIDTTPASEPSSAPSTIREDFALARSVGTVVAYDAFLDRYGEDQDDFSVQLALQLRRQLSEKGSTDAARSAEAPDTVRQTQTPQTTVAEPVPTTTRNRRDIIRQTQARLNELGCNAGATDGILGRRTRAAFARYVEVSGSDLGPDALGTLEALAWVSRQHGPSCLVLAAEPAPKPTGQASTQAKAVTRPPAPESKPSLTLAGTWSFTANCALFIKSKGTVRFRHVRDNFYTGSVQDNLGNKGNSEAYLNGRNISSTEYFPGLTVRFNGRLSADGRSYTGSGSNTCKVYARKN